MNCLQFISLYTLILLSDFSAQAQFRAEPKPFIVYVLNTEGRADKQSWLASQAKSSYQQPMLAGLAAAPYSNRSTYWLSQVTSQTMNDGKMGTYYMWDQLGNLRESRFFMDIGGKKRPGLKLVFPRR